MASHVPRTRFSNPSSAAGLDELQATVAVLGAQHPLACAVAARRTVSRQAASTLALGTAALIAAILGPRSLVFVAASAGIVLAVLAIVAVVLRQHERLRADDLIIGGGERLPVPAVERERLRLGKPRTRRILADGLDRTAHDALHPTRHVFIHPRIVRPHAQDLQEAAALLRAGPPRAAGIALAEQLLTGRHPALYGYDGTTLRGELLRLRYLLESSPEDDASG